MIFVKFTYANGKAFSFCLDHLVTFEQENDEDTKIELSNGRQEVLDIDLDSFCAKIFSDENLVKEYTLVEIEGREPPENFSLIASMGQVT